MKYNHYKSMLFRTTSAKKIQQIRALNGHITLLLQSQNKKTLGNIK